MSSEDISFVCFKQLKFRARAYVSLHFVQSAGIIRHCKQENDTLLGFKWFGILKT